MADISLKEYIKRAKELEVAVYTQRALMNEHEAVLLKKRPIHPKKKTVEMPTAFSATYPQRDSQMDTMLNCALIIMLIGCLLGVFFGISAEDDGARALGQLLACGGVVGALYFGGQRLSSNKEYNDAVRNYYCEKDKNAREVEVAKREQAQEDRKYNDLLNQYNTQLSRCKEAEDTALEPHKTCLLALEEALAVHYDQNKLFSKYRNLIAVVTIDEYLQSGRCETLEGSSGAYNLFEMELRQNIVIGQLSAVLDNIEQVKNNQYTLYQELSRTNNLVSDIITEIRELNTTGKLNAYFSAVNAQIAASPTYIHGHIY